MSATPLPSIFRVQQHFETPVCADVEAEVAQQLDGLHLKNQVRPGDTVAITAGSRGIANIARILKSTVAHLAALGAKPFLVPSMGSHGGGTAEGQRRVIESYGITEEFCACPIRSSMETVVIGEAAEGFPVFFDRHAFEADHVVVCGRIKPHTNFTGDIQSGLLKMMMIGLGKKDGATLYHQAIQEHGFPQIIRSVAPAVLAKGNILAGIAIVENAEDETARIEAIAPEAFIDREKDLLRVAKRWMPTLPFQEIDVLVVDEIGKNISGTGFDTNVIGRKHSEDSGDQPCVKRIIVRGLTPETHGNAAGIGLADFCLSRVVQQMDRHATILNCLTACHVDGAKVPVDYATDREALSTAIGTVGMRSPTTARVVWIRNTLDLVQIECSAAMREEAGTSRNLAIMTENRQLPLDDEGMLPDRHFDDSEC